MPVTPAFAQNNNGGAPELTYSAFVRCDGIVRSASVEPNRQKTCNLIMLVETVIKIVNWAFYITIPIATALFAYAGVLYMTGQKGKIDNAKKIFSSVAIGFAIMCVAWIGMRTVVGWIVDPASGATTFIE